MRARIDLKPKARRRAPPCEPACAAAAARKPLAAMPRFRPDRTAPAFAVAPTLDAGTRCLIAREADSIKAVLPDPVSQERVDSVAELVA